MSVLDLVAFGLVLLGFFSLTLNRLTLNSWRLSLRRERVLLEALIEVETAGPDPALHSAAVRRGRAAFAAEIERQLAYEQRHFAWLPWPVPPRVDEPWPS